MMKFKDNVSMDTWIAGLRRGTNSSETIREKKMFFFRFSSVDMTTSEQSLLLSSSCIMEVIRRICPNHVKLLKSTRPGPNFCTN